MHLFFALDTCIINIYNEIEVITPTLFRVRRQPHVVYVLTLISFFRRITITARRCDDC